MEAITEFVGRDAELNQCGDCVRDGHSVAVRGRPGIGKSALLLQLYQAEQARGMNPLWLASAPPKTMLLSLAEQVQAACGLVAPEPLIPPRRRHLARKAGKVHWDWIQPNLSRATVPQLSRLLLTSISRRRLVIFVESLELPQPQANFLLEVIKRAQLIAASASSGYCGISRKSSKGRPQESFPYARAGKEYISNGSWANCQGPDRAENQPEHLPITRCCEITFFQHQFSIFILRLTLMDPRQPEAPGLLPRRARKVKPRLQYDWFRNLRTQRVLKRLKFIKTRQPTCSIIMHKR